MAAAVHQDSDVDDGWVHIDLSNPADSDDDDAGVRALSSGRATPEYRSDDDECLRRVRLLDLDYEPEEEEEDEDEDEDDAVAAPHQTPPPIAAPNSSRPLSGLFHHTPAGAVDYAPFEPVRLWPPKELVLDPTFSACKGDVTVLASTGGLVCLRSATNGRRYILANPRTHTRVTLPRASCDHRAYGDPAVVVTFEDDAQRAACCADHRGHYHVVVAFPLGDGVYAYESFSSRTWAWTVADGVVSAVEEVVSASGVGAMGRAFWRTTIGHLLCYDPAKRAADLIPAPQVALECPNWELGEIHGTLVVTCMDDRVNDVFVNILCLEDEPPTPKQQDEEDGDKVLDVKWTLAGHFEGGCLRNHDGVRLLRSQGHEVVMWDPTLEQVVAMDIEGRTTRTIGPLSGRHYCSDFIPYVSSSNGIIGAQAGAVCMFPAAKDEE